MDPTDVPAAAPPRADEPTAASATHVPVLLDRVLELLAPCLDSGVVGTDTVGTDAAGTAAPGTDTGTAAPVAVDATVGLAGHAEALLTAFPRLTLVGLDRDPDALDRARRRLAPFAPRFHLVQAVYDRLPAVLADLGYPVVRAVLFDLGVSSLQLDVAARGFSYARQAPLDMRMDASSGMTAADVVNTYPVPELARVLRDYGEERFALRIAQAIDRARRVAPLTSTDTLAEIVRTAIPAATRRHGGHPAKRTFQALRIEVNAELDALRAAVPAAVQALDVGGRIVVLSYHSLEDRIVKKTLAAGAADHTPAGLPVALASHAARLRLLTRGGEGASDAEIAANPRAASVRLRAAERIAAGPVDAPPDAAGRHGTGAS